MTKNDVKKIREQAQAVKVALVARIDELGTWECSRRLGKNASYVSKVRNKKGGVTFETAANMLETLLEK